MDHSARSWPRTLAAYALVTLAPAAAWLAWISWSDGKAGDASHVAWFLTVALASLGAGGLAPRRAAHHAALTVVAVVTTLATLYWWWSSQDDSGLFLVGLAVAAPLVLFSAVLLLQLGSFLIPRRRATIAACP